mmetsp:Transcript_4712/g.10177  ORF Transcript_4712/g.10177 Transcript_4712/m.10177 type:complete len:236 (-) Transcript_4712:96-803(-)
MVMFSTNVTARSSRVAPCRAVKESGASSTTTTRRLTRRPQETHRREGDGTVDVSRRDVVLRSPAAAGLFLGALFSFGAAPRPKGLGVTDYGSGVKSLGLCPATNNCISTAEAANDMNHYVPGWNYAPEDGRAMREEVTQSKAMGELKEVIETTQPDGFTPTIVQETADYIYVEYESPTFGFIDDVEFWFPGGGKTTVEYRSASRIGESDGDINRKRIKALREELEKKGWKSVGFY